jgi:hypothetical protein
MSQYYIHVGVPKTGTTSIQSLLRINKKELQNLGLSIILPRDVRHTSFMSYYLSQHTNGRIKSSADYQTAINSLQDILNDNVKTDRVVISEEGFLQDVIPNSFWKGSFGGVDFAAKTLKTFFGDSCKIIIYIRRHDTFLQSCYVHQIKYKGKSFDFQEYISKVLNLFDLAWKKTIDPFVEVFGLNNVIVRCYEDWSLGAEFAFREFLKPILNYEQLDSDLSSLKYDLSNMAINSSYSQDALEIAIKCNPHIPPTKRKLFARFLIENFPIEQHGKAHLWDEDQRHQLLQYYQASNIDIFKKFISDRNPY